MDLKDHSGTNVKDTNEETLDKSRASTGKSVLCH